MLHSLVASIFLYASRLSKRYIMYDIGQGRIVIRSQYACNQHHPHIPVSDLPQTTKGFVPCCRSS